MSSSKYKVDLIATFPDENDELVLHWGISRDKVGNWSAPDKSSLPTESKLNDDGFSADTEFKRFPGNSGVRKISLTFESSQGVDPVKSLNFVLFEKEKDLWHSFDGKDKQILLSTDASDK